MGNKNSKQMRPRTIGPPYDFAHTYHLGVNQIESIQNIEKTLSTSNSNIFSASNLLSPIKNSSEEDLSFKRKMVQLGKEFSGDEMRKLALKISPPKTLLRSAEISDLNLSVGQEDKELHDTKHQKVLSEFEKIRNKSDNASVLTN